MPEPEAGAAVGNRFMMADPYHIIIATQETLMGVILQVTFSQFYPTATLSLVPAGLDALVLYDQRGADLVISTEHIGIIDSVDLTRTLRDQNLDLPLIMLSSQCAQAQAAAEAGASLFLCHPNLLEKLKLALPNLLAL